MVACVSHAQSLLHHPLSYFTPAPGTEKYYSDLNKDTRQGHSFIKYSLDVGTTFTGMNGYGSLGSSYLSPSVRYRVSPKIELELGGAIMYNFVSGSPVSNMGDSPSSGNNFTSYLFYTKGNYQVNEKLNINGAFVKSIANDALFYQYPYQVNPDFESYSLGLNYKLSDAIRIGAHFNFSNGINPYYYSSPLNRRISGFHSPYDPFYPEW